MAVHLNGGWACSELEHAICDTGLFWWPQRQHQFIADFAKSANYLGYKTTRRNGWAIEEKILA